MTWKTLLFSAEGRINRAKYWLGAICSTVVLLALSGILVVPLVMTMGPDNQLSGVGILAIVGMLLLAIASMYVSIMLGIKRWHDRDKSGWWVLIGLIPYVGFIWVFVECGCLPGTNGRNRFGPDPLALNQDLVGVFDAPQGAPVIR